MKKELVCVFMSLSSLCGYAQDKSQWIFAGDVFYGTFDMSQLKSVLSTGTRSGKFLSGNIGYTAQAYYVMKIRLGIGIRYQYTSTSGSDSFGDNTITVNEELLPRSNSFGLSFQYPITKPTALWCLYANATFGMAFTRVTSNFQVHDSGGDFMSSWNAYSTNYFVNPALRLEHKLFGPVSGYGTAGYEFQTHDQLKAKHNDGSLNDNGKPVTAQWDGFRGGVGVMVKL